MQTMTAPMYDQLKLLKFMRDNIIATQQQLERYKKEYEEFQAGMWRYFPFKIGDILMDLDTHEVFKITKLNSISVSFNNDLLPTFSYSFSRNYITGLAKKPHYYWDDTVSFEHNYLVHFKLIQSTPEKSPE